jgi:hypothetical protein
LISEPFVEDAALAWIEALGCEVMHGPDITAGELGDPNYRDVVPKTLISRELRVRDAEHQVEQVT